MRTRTLLAFLTFVPFALAQVAGAASLDVDFITRYCNEEIQTAILASQPRMQRNISNSLMTAAPSYLDQSVYLQRRSNMDLCPQLIGIGEISTDWLRPDRVSVSGPAVVIAAVSEQLYPGAGALLSSLGWTPLNDTIRLNYVVGATNLPLYAGLVPAGAVSISGSGVNALLVQGSQVPANHFFFFQDAAAMPPEILAQLQVVPEPEMGVLLIIGATLLLGSRVVRPRSATAKRSCSV